MSISIATRVLAEPLAAKESELFDNAKFAIPEKFRRHPLFNTPHCGVNFGFLARRGYFSRPEVRKQPTLIREAGANWVTLNTHFCLGAVCRAEFLEDRHDMVLHSVH